jgi:cold shock CspA family protein
MRQGKIQKWFPERGFGFVKDLHDKSQHFLHVSKLDCGYVPTIADRLEFEIGPGRDGRSQVTEARLVDYEQPVTPPVRFGED